ncbi:LysE family translocator [Chelatococcus asaccharovorans]|uniref:Putative LysE/RhtB family amino acid efflux pump n=1 Tax=Chelatococcus asaccharovorans TaxID=28210 RepID=A0A2V3U677_9HYPH|nr:LysE family transporter [Chelatococcus asaccharovorans]MBS7705654.1 LysE family transporter [Chelatococcus asaccharovorans]PXW58672.1 putative LysE/RhtB family amino acid efflux pump [Chelatococcus asaccharovorans]CAH1656816.1 putative LysE/RhtB family amino acid efflux pump [Chelatococcus asaccharovorans]CAH1684979.1 putative LysE/RhtB family amino acid efflux pump [Chelatococcus asaccharovorans]
MDPLLFWKSLLLGLAVAAPLGPIGALCINRTLERGFAAGVAGGLGTALADGLYAALAAFGFAAFSEVLTSVDMPLRIAGGAFMLWLGWKSLTPHLPRTVAEATTRDLMGTTAATFLLTLTNPMTILSFAALFAGLGLAAAAGTTEATLVVAGVFAGSMLWWCLLSGGVAIARHRLPAAFARWISRISGGVLIAFGLWAILSVAF